MLLTGRIAAPNGQVSAAARDAVSGLLLGISPRSGNERNSLPVFSQRLCRWLNHSKMNALPLKGGYFLFSPWAITDPASIGRYSEAHGQRGQTKLKYPVVQQAQAKAIGGFAFCPGRCFASDQCAICAPTSRLSSAIGHRGKQRRCP
jgi:hypothetical protein